MGLYLHYGAASSIGPPAMLITPFTAVLGLVVTAFALPLESRAILPAVLDDLVFCEQHLLMPLGRMPNYLLLSL